MKLYIICVLYSGYIQNITSLEQFLRLRDEYNVEIMILDNSTADFVNANELLASQEYYGRIRYIPNHGNIGLSKSYNKAISIIDDEEYWIMISDDDTQFSYEYLENAMQHVMHGNEKVISGIVYSDRKNVLSPVKKMQLLNKPKDFVCGDGVYKDIYCINSGLFVHNSVLKCLGAYPETIFLDMLDYWFMEALKKKHINSIRIVNGSIIQSFSGNIQTDIEKIKARNAIYKKDLKEFCKIYPQHFLLGILLVMKREIKILMLRHGGEETR